MHKFIGSSKGDDGDIDVKFLRDLHRWRGNDDKLENAVFESEGIIQGSRAWDILSQDPWMVVHETVLFKAWRPSTIG